MANPSKIIEGSVEYSIGRFNGIEMLYDFDKILIYLAAKGKLLFGKDFKIHQDDEALILKLCNYIINDVESCKKHNIDLTKGILLTGPVGCGKTSLMRLIQHIVPLKRPYQLIPSRNIVFAFNHIGFKIIEDYGEGKSYCFDDLGIEPKGKHYGQDCNVIGEILISRYELFVNNNNIKTHATTNLNSDELEDFYGNRVRSRMRKMFNLIAFDDDTKDKRK